jgi:hypothetical protein
METFGAWLFFIGLVFNPIVFIIYVILDIKYKDDFIVREFNFDLLMPIKFLCWSCMVGGILLVYYF